MCGIRRNLHPLLRMALAATALSLGACEAPLYKPYEHSTFLWASSPGWGYMDVPIRANYYEVGYSSEFTVNPTEARYYATLRAAELALDHNKSYFEIVQARPGETPQTWASLGVASTPTTAPGIQAENNTISLDQANSVLLIRLLDAPTPASLDALELLRAAQQQGITFDANAESRLAQSPPKTSTTRSSHP